MEIFVYDKVLLVFWDLGGYRIVDFCNLIFVEKIEDVEIYDLVIIVFCIENEVFEVVLLM